MHYEIINDPKQESYVRTAFLEQVSSYNAAIVVVVTPHDRVDQEQPPTLDNFAIPRHHLPYIDRVVLVEDQGARDILYDRGLNKG